MPVLPPNITPPVFYPQYQIISAITNSVIAVVTTTTPHNYKDFLIVRLNIPQVFGMQQANQLQATIVVLNPTQFALVQNGPNGATPVDSTLFDAFVVPVDFNTPAQVTPMGEDAITFENVTKNILPL